MLQSQSIKRRQFLKQAAGSVAGIGAASLCAESAVADEPMPTLKGLPRKKLPRIGFEMPRIGLGTAALGHVYHKDHAAGQEPFNKLFDMALAAGINYIDSAVIYDAALPCLGPLMEKHRKDVFIVSKTMKKTKDEALREIYKSLELLRVDVIDLFHIHNVGEFTTEQAIGRNSCLAAILEAKKRGIVRFIGASGHERPARFLPVLETGQIDLLMVAMNFVDRYTYNFEEVVVPTAQKHNMAILAIKSLGGAIRWGYRKRVPGIFTAKKYYNYAVRYSQEIPGVHGVVMGLRDEYELRMAINAVHNCKLLTDEEKRWLAREGKALAAERGEFLGPVEA